MGRVERGVDRRHASPLGAAVTVAELEADPHPALARLRRHEPVSWLPALDAWLVTRRDLALAVMRDPETYTVDDPRFSTARVVGASMLSLDGADHARHRGPFARPFRLAEVRRRHSERVVAEADRLIDAVRPRGEAELRGDLAGPLAVAAMADALGLDDADPATLLRWYEAIVAGVAGVSAGRPVPDEATEAFGRLAGAVHAHLAAPPAGGSLLAAAAGAGGLSAAEVVADAAVLLFGGIETTEGMILNAALHLLSDPAHAEAVRTGAVTAAAAVEESLRLEPAAASVDRYAARDAVLGDARIARGDLVTVSIAGANRDPAVFPDPDRFDPARTEARLHVAFAHGPHVCLGMHLARLEAQVAVERLLARLPGLRLDAARPAAARGLVFRKPPALHVRFTPPGAAAAGPV